MYDFYLEYPDHSLLTYQNKPFLRKGAKAPPKPAPAVAPVQANLESGQDEALLASKSRKGLRSTILADSKPLSTPQTGGVTKLGQTTATTLGTLSK